MATDEPGVVACIRFRDAFIARPRRIDWTAQAFVFLFFCKQGRHQVLLLIFEVPTVAAVHLRDAVNSDPCRQLEGKLAYHGCCDAKVALPMEQVADFDL